jgi:alpha-L-fucosidase
MKRSITIVIVFLVAFKITSFCQEEIELARPSPIQYKWHEQERIMFVCLDPCTWQGREYDNHSLSLDRINPVKLNTDQWCEVAQSWGAKEILFVAKHTGGFCWWQTATTEYSIKNTPYKNGKGDVLKELSESCKKYDLTLGIYVYPGDETWGAGIGSGGQTQDPAKQEAYNMVFRQQLTETLTKYGDIIEVWFDGSCKIDVSDILEKHAKNSVIFQGPHATLRWPGTESGKLFYPAWNSLSKVDMNTGVATQVHGNPDGNVWAPLETNTTLYDHYWFWAPDKEQKRISVDQLVHCFYQSVGYGSVFLLNSSPDTTGLIPADDVEHYKEFGKELARRFDNPIAKMVNEKGVESTLTLPKIQKINHVISMEDYRHGHRIRSYVIEGLVNGDWIELCKGQSIGRKKIDYFPEVELAKIRVKIDKHVGDPLIRSLSAHYVEKFNPPPLQPISPWSEWRTISDWKKKSNFEGQMELHIDLSEWINLPGQYRVRLISVDSGNNIEILQAEIYYDERKALNEFVEILGNEININRTAMVTEESSSVLKLTMRCDKDCNTKVEFKPAILY